MIDLYDLDRSQLEALLVSWGHKGFRAKQVWTWLYDHHATSFAQMSNLPADLRKRLASETTLGTLSIRTEQTSDDGTIKRLYALSDGKAVEAVLMRYNDGRNTACISTQAGCAMGCVFCATGQMGFARNLSTTEIFEQAQQFSKELKAEGGRLSNVVLMGMGEPFHNYDASVAAIRRIMDELGIGARRITVSTVGLVPAIRRFADEGLQVGLAISLHEADDTARDALLPVNRKYPIAELMNAVRHYVAKTNRRVTFEWALIAGTNDDAKTAHALGKLLRGIHCHVNLIPLNPTQGYAGEPTDVPDAATFVAVLEEYGVPATMRVRRGIDIDAGCGQLASREDGDG